MRGFGVLTVVLALTACAGARDSIIPETPGPIHVAVQYFRAHDSLQIGGKVPRLLLDSRRLPHNAAPRAVDPGRHPPTSIVLLKSNEVTLLSPEIGKRCARRMEECADRGRVFVQLAEPESKDDSATIAFRVLAYSDPDSASLDRISRGQPPLTTRLWVGNLHLKRDQTGWRISDLRNEARSFPVMGDTL